MPCMPQRANMACCTGLRAAALLDPLSLLLAVLALPSSFAYDILGHDLVCAILCCQPSAQGAGILADWVRLQPTADQVLLAPYPGGCLLESCKNKQWYREQEGLCRRRNRNTRLGKHPWHACRAHMGGMVKCSMGQAQRRDNSLRSVTGRVSRGSVGCWRLSLAVARNRRASAQHSSVHHKQTAFPQAEAVKRRCTDTHTLLKASRQNLQGVIHYHNTTTAPTTPAPHSKMERA